MSSLTFLFGVALCLATVLAAGNVCNVETQVSRPSSNKPYYWPTTWNENQTAPALKKQQNCAWNVAIPQGYYARLIVSSKTTAKDAMIQTIDSAGNMIETTQEGMEPYFFPGTRVVLVVTNADTFAFKIQWFKLPAISKIVGIGSIYHLINVTQSVFAYEYSASPVSLITFPAEEKHHFSLRSTLIYQGNSFDSGFVGSLYTIYKTPNQWLSDLSLGAYGNIVVANLEASQYQDQLLIQDGSKTKDIAKYDKLVPNKNGTNVISINGGTQKSAIVTVSNLNQTLTAVDLLDSASVSVYFGTPDPFTLDKMYTGVTLKKALPLLYPGGGVWQFVLKTGKATFTFKH